MSKSLNKKCPLFPLFEGFWTRTWIIKSVAAPYWSGSVAKCAQSRSGLFFAREKIIYFGKIENGFHKKLGLFVKEIWLGQSHKKLGLFVKEMWLDQSSQEQNL